MNKKGQTLVIFVILLPIILAICAIVVDVGIMSYQKVKVTNLTRNILQLNILSSDVVYNAYKRNNINTDNLEVNIKDNSVEIINDYYIESFFGKIINKDKYEIRIKGTVYYPSKKIVIE